VLALQVGSSLAAQQVKSHVAADGTISNSRVSAQTTDVQGLLNEVEAMANSGGAPDDEKVKTIDELIDEPRRVAAAPVVVAAAGRDAARDGREGRCAALPQLSQGHPLQGQPRQEQNA